MRIPDAWMPGNAKFPATGMYFAHTAKKMKPLFWVFAACILPVLTRS
jgi:hypothetical protein